MTGRAALAGAVYFALVYVVAFILGVVRTLVLVPAVGPMPALLIELPILLIVCWIACRWTVGRFALPATAGPRLVMGGTAFVLLMATELILSVVLFGRAPGQHFAGYATWLGAAGLLPQIAFALFPLVQLRQA